VKRSRRLPRAITRRFLIARRIAIVLAAVALYIGTYAALSAAGQPVFSQTGQLRYSFGFAVSDVVIWDPPLAKWEPFHTIDGVDTSRGNLVGYFYSPLIRLDRRFWHPTQFLFATRSR
jgi:hypothetical protein